MKLSESQFEKLTKLMENNYESFYQKFSKQYVDSKSIYYDINYDVSKYESQTITGPYGESIYLVINNIDHEFLKNIEGLRIFNKCLGDNLKISDTQIYCNDLKKGIHVFPTNSLLALLPKY